MTASDSLGGGAIAGIVLSLLVLVPLLGFAIWYGFRIYQRRMRRVRPYEGTVDLVKERYNPGHRSNPSQSSGRVPLLENIERPQTPESIRSVSSNTSSWLHGSRSYQPSKPTSLSYSYHEVGDEEQAIARILDISNPRRAPVPIGVPPRRPAEPLETIYSASTDSTARFIDKFPAPPKGLLKGLGNRLSRSFNGLANPPDSHQEWRPTHKHSVSVDDGASSLRSYRARIPPPPSLPPPTAPPKMPLPKVPRAKIVPLSPVPNSPILSPPNSSESNRGIPFDVDMQGGVVLESFAVRPLRPLRPGQTHKKSASAD